jgi:hypothetical protein
MTTPDAPVGPAGYTVKFGVVARTIDYTDDAARFTFTFDIGPRKGPPWTLILEHHAQTERTAAYLLAFTRTKQYVESRGYNVEVA